MAFLESYENPVQTLSRTMTMWMNADERKYLEIKYSEELVQTDRGLYFSEEHEDKILRIIEVNHSS